MHGNWHVARLCIYSYVVYITLRQNLLYLRASISAPVAEASVIGFLLLWICLQKRRCLRFLPIELHQGYVYVYILYFVRFARGIEFAISASFYIQYINASFNKSSLSSVRLRIYYNEFILRAALSCNMRVRECYKRVSVDISQTIKGLYAVLLG